MAAWIQRFVYQLTEAVKKRKEDKSEVKRRNLCRTTKKGNVKHDERRHHSPIAAELTVEEVAKAEKFWVHSAQTDAFENERRELEISQSIQVWQAMPMKQRGKTGKGSRLPVVHGPLASKQR